MRPAALALVLLLSAAASGPALAKGGAFVLRNAATSPVVSFQTREEGTWSANWLAAPVAPGESFRMKFGASDGDCVLKTRVRFQGGATAEADVDYCDAQTLTVTEQGVAVAGQ